MTPFPRLSTVLVLCATAGAAGPAAAAAQTGDPPARRATATISAGVGGTRMLGGTRMATEAAFTVGVARRTAVGLTGWSLTRPVPLDGGSESDLELRTAFGGVIVEHRLVGWAPIELSAAFTAGAGNAKVRLPVVDTEVAADNFAVLEPAVAVDRALRFGLSVQAWVRYRYVLGVEDLPGIGAADLRGASVSLRVSLRLGGRDATAGGGALLRSPPR